MSTSRRRQIITPVLLLGTFTVLGIIGLALSQPLPQRPRLTVFISDLHLGVGVDPQTGTWHPMEDFRWKDEFAQFLKEIDQRGRGATDLVLNGDTLELWQSLEPDCFAPDTNLGCTAVEALSRARRVLAAHTPELQALGEFASSGENRVIVIPGNHDAALLFPDVARTVLQAIAAPPGRVRIASEGYWLSADRLVFAEHGHQIGKEVNKFDGWPSPFIEREGRTYLQRPWGEQFVQAYYNEVESRLPIIDNMADEQDGLRYGLAAEGVAGSARAVRDFLKFFLFEVSWVQWTQSLGPESKDPHDRAPEWDINRIREEQGNRFLVESLPTHDPLRPAAETALAQGALTLSLTELTDDEIVTLCDQRAALRRTQVNLQQPLTISECPRKDPTLGAIAENLLRSRYAVMGAHLEQTYQVLASSVKTDRPFMVFVYSHTHRAERAFSPLKGDWRPAVVNTGAWQRVVSSEQLQEIKGKVKGDQPLRTEHELLHTLTLEELPACYSIILIEPYIAPMDPIPLLRYWRKNKGGAWEISKSCR